MSRSGQTTKAPRRASAQPNATSTLADPAKAPLERHTDPAKAPLVPSGDESAPVSCVAADFEAGHRIARHRHARAQLAYAIEGVMSVTTAAGLWVVPPLRALWIPPGVVHSIWMTGKVRMRTVYFDAAVLAQSSTPNTCTVLTVSPLMRELIVRLVHETVGEVTTEVLRRDRVVSVLLDELAVAQVSPLELPIPADSRLRRITDALHKDPADGRNLAEWARLAGVSERSLSRLFLQSTGMTLVRWRQQLRLLRALERLGAGEGVTAVAMDLGYTSPSAFVTLFRENLGVTPGRYFAAG